MEDISKFRNKEHSINEIFVNRWSPRAMSGETLEKESLLELFEAARWAPSAFNSQSWRFVYALKETENWNNFFNLLNESNQSWAKNSAALIIIVSKKTFDYNDKPAPTHSFDTGAAWENLALQGSMSNLVVHGMSGFDYEKAAELVNATDKFQVEAMIAIGKPGKKEDLPEKVQEREFPSDRKKVKEFAFEGTLKIKTEEN